MYQSVPSTDIYIIGNFKSIPYGQLPQQIPFASKYNKIVELMGEICKERDWILDEKFAEKSNPDSDWLEFIKRSRVERKKIILVDVD